MPGGLAEGKRFRVFLVGYSHIDSEWLWDLEETIEVCKETFENVVNLMEKYGEITFTQGPSLYYELIEKRYPKLYKKIADYMNEGRWLAAAAPFLEFDANIPSGESLIRHLLRGRSYIERSRNVKDLDVLFLPDSFGFPATLPKILNGFGVKYFVTYKLAWNDANEYPYNLFRWRDGDSEVMTYLLPGSYSDYLSDVKRIIWNILSQWRKQRIPVILQVYGRGDHGGGPEEEEVVNLRLWKRKWHPIIVFEHGGMGDFFSYIERNYRGELPKVSGELYLEFHRGVYTTGALVKKLNRLNEHLALQVEKIYSILTVISDAEYPAEIEDVWSLILLNQGHDALPATVPREVFEKIAERGLTSFKRLLKLLRLGLSKLGAENAGYVIFNPNSWPASIYLRVKGEDRSIRGQEIGDEKIVFVKDLPPMGFRVTGHLGDDPGDEARVEDRGDHYILENKYLRVTIDKDAGWIKSVYDKVNEREVLRDPIRLRIRWDHPTPSRMSAASAAMFDAWEAYYSDGLNKYFYRDLRAHSHKVSGRGPLYASVVMDYGYRQLSSGKSSLELEVGLYADKPYLEIIFRAEWRSKHRFLKLLIPLKTKSRKALFETPYGVVERPDACEASSPMDRAKHEVCGHRWVDVSDGEYGVAVINDSRYGFSFCRGVLAVSLLRSPSPPLKSVLMKLISSSKEFQKNFKDISLALTGKMSKKALNLGSWLLTMVLELLYMQKLRPVDNGYHSAKIWIYPHNGSYSEASVPNCASELNTVYIVQRNGSSFEESSRDFSLLEISPIGEVQLTVFKPGEKGGGYVARLYNTSPQTVKAEVKFNFAVKRVQEADLAEKPVKEIPLNDGRLSIRFKPLEVKTLLLEIRKQAR